MGGGADDEFGAGWDVCGCYVIHLWWGKGGGGWGGVDIGEKGNRVDSGEGGGWG